MTDALPPYARSVWRRVFPFMRDDGGNSLAMAQAGPGQCIGDGVCKGNTADGKLSARTRSIAKAKRPHFWSGIVSTVS